MQRLINERRSLDATLVAAHSATFFERVACIDCMARGIAVSPHLGEAEPVSFLGWAATKSTGFTYYRFPWQWIH
jgi:hypothetical protein